MEINSPPGATPIEPDDLNDLIPRLTTRGELNEFEHLNIFKAIIAARKSRKLKRDLLTIDSLTWLHRQMFKGTWQWAGKFRTRQTNIGVEPYQIREQLVVLCTDAKYWIENSTYELPVCAVRIHHRLAKIHPFFNGNGRHARLVADLMMFYSGLPEFSWGGRQLLGFDGEIRNRYLAALGEADIGNYDDLLKFAQAN